MAANTIELNNDFKQALELMETTSRNIFITGKAGTGKSTLLQCFVRMTAKKAVVLAPTGVAALNAGGETIHSFFKFKPGITPDRIKRPRTVNKRSIYRNIDVIVIDEISMVRADLMDCMDRFMRCYGRDPELPFGGAQMILFGDLFQLPPVVQGAEKELFAGHYETPYFFSAKAFENLRLEYLELRKVYRQNDEKFIDLLNAIRDNTVTYRDIHRLNERVGIIPPDDNEEFYVCLTTTNRRAYEINEEQLERLKDDLYIFQAMPEGQFDEKYYPADFELRLKAGAQVMLLNNDPQGRWVNGSIGKVLTVEPDFDRRENVVVVELINGDVVDVPPFKWNIFQYRYNGDTRNIESEPVGSYRQYPIRLAWAVTIHKSQGKTFERVIIDVGDGTFAHGQLYVALSRCTSLDGILLKSPIRRDHIIMDHRVLDFLERYRTPRIVRRHEEMKEPASPEQRKIELIRQAISDGSLLEITYLDSSNETTKRLIKPYSVGEKKCLKSSFTGVQALCYMRKDRRTFKLDRILELKIV